MTDTFFDGADPKLKELAAKIKALLEQYQVAGAYQLASSTHAEYGLVIPEWSAVRFEPGPNGDGEVGIRIKAKAEDTHLLEASVHLWLSIRDAVMMQAAGMLKYGDAIERVLEQNGVELEHKTLFDRVAEDADA